MSIVTDVTQTRLRGETVGAGEALGGRAPVTPSSTAEPSVRPRAHRVRVTCAGCGRRHSVEEMRVDRDARRGEQGAALPLSSVAAVGRDPHAVPDGDGARVGDGVDLSWMGEETREYAQGLFDQADREFQAWTAGYLAEHGHRPTHAEVVAKVEEVAMPQWAAIERFHAAHREVTREELAYGPHSERAPLPAPSAVERMTDHEVDAAFARHFAGIERQTDEEAIGDVEEGGQ